MAEIFQVETDEHKAHVRELYWEYIEYVRQMIVQEFGVDFEVAPIVERDMNELYKLSPPHGRLFLIQLDDQIAGLGGLRQIGEGIGEIKRMFVRPNFQSRGLGRRLLELLIAEARQVGYKKVRLDVGSYAESAEKLYRSTGFSNIMPYPESEAPLEVHSKWQFMELLLQ